MKVITIDWEKRVIKEYETEIVKYEKEGVSIFCGDNHCEIKIPYNKILKIKAD